MPKSQPTTPQPANTKLKDIISGPLFNGAVSIAGLIAAVASDEFWVRVPALLVLVISAFFFIKAIWPWLQRIITWLTWKFVAGVLVGIVTGAFLMPTFFQPAFDLAISLVSPRVEVLSSKPGNNEFLRFRRDNVELRFSERIPVFYRQFIKIEIAPDTPIKKIWIREEPFIECCSRLDIRPNKLFPDAIFTLFEADTTYTVRVSGPLLRDPVIIVFHTY